MSLGKGAATVLRAASPDLSFPLLAIKEGVPSSTLKMRPDIRITELDIDRANAQIGICKSNFYPALIITAQGGINSFVASNWFTISASLFGNVLGGITQPVFESRKLRAQYEIAKIEREESVVRFRQQVKASASKKNNYNLKLNCLDIIEL